MVANKQLTSVRECKQELETYGKEDFLKTWIKRNSKMFLPATAEEAAVVAEIFRVPHFLQLVSATAQLKGKPVADPFLIASAKINGRVLITEEELKPHAAKIPNICEHFGIAYASLEEMMEMEGLTF